MTMQIHVPSVSLNEEAGAKAGAGKVDEPFTKVHGGLYGAPVFKNGVQIGRVTKFTYGYSVNKWVGFALIKAGSAVPGDEVILNWDDKAIVRDKPIYKK